MLVFFLPLSFLLFFLPIALGSQSAGFSIEKIACLLNQKREAKSVKPLGISHQLAFAAQLHSNNMAAKNKLMANGSDNSTVGTRVSATGFEWSHVAQNIAYGMSSDTVAVDDWMNSTSNAANIMNPNMTLFGCAVANSSEKPPKLFYTLVLAAIVGETSATNVTKCENGNPVGGGSAAHTSSPSSQGTTASTSSGSSSSGSSDGSDTSEESEETTTSSTTASRSHAPASHSHTTSGTATATTSSASEHTTAATAKYDWSIEDDNVRVTNAPQQLSENLMTQLESADSKKAAGFSWNFTGTFIVTNPPSKLAGDLMAQLQAVSKSSPGFSWDLSMGSLRASNAPKTVSKSMMELLKAEDEVIDDDSNFEWTVTGNFNVTKPSQTLIGELWKVLNQVPK